MLGSVTYLWMIDTLKSESLHSVGHIFYACTNVQSVTIKICGAWNEVPEGKEGAGQTFNRWGKIATGVFTSVPTLTGYVHF